MSARPPFTPRPAPPDALVGDADVARLARLRGLASLLDSAVAIPGTRIRVGLDPLIGLVPGMGDLVSGAVSAYLVAEAARLGVPRATLVRMLANVALDTAAGSVPVLGDLFDVAWRSNARNVELLARHVESPTAARRENRLFAIGAVLVVLLIVAAGLAATVAVVRWMAAQF